MQTDKHIRVFLCLPLCEEVKSKLEEWQQKILYLTASPEQRLLLKAVQRDDLHLTLNFFGKISESLIPELIDTVNNALSEVKTLTLNPLCPEIIRKEKQSLLWLRCRDSEEYARLHHHIYHATKKLAPYQDHRRLPTPHITLFRFRKLKLTTIDWPHLNIPEIQGHRLELWNSADPQTGTRKYACLSVFNLTH